MRKSKGELEARSSKTRALELGKLHLELKDRGKKRGR
jgi:hypothetical protein